MRPILFTLADGQTKLRATPTDVTEANVLVALPPMHPVTQEGRTDGNWILVSTTYQNRLWQGYINETRLRPSGGLYEPVTSDIAVPARDKVIVDPDSESLKAFLTIQKPNEASRGLEAISFRRSRLLELSWRYIFSKELTEKWVNNPQPNFRESSRDLNYFANHWISLGGLAVEAGAPKYIRAVARAYTASITVVPLKAGTPPYFFGGRGTRRDVAYEEKQAVIVLTHPVAERYFCLIPKPNTTIVMGDFVDGGQPITEATFRSVLDQKVDSIRQCHLTNTDVARAIQLVSDAEDVDLGPAYIIRQNAELQALSSFTTKLSEVADKAGLAAVNGLIDEQQVNALLRAVLEMKTPELERGLRIQQLRDKASALGYTLYLGDKKQTVSFEDGTSYELEPGNLYRPYLALVSWVTEHKRSSSYSDSGFFGIGASSGTREWTEFVNHVKQVIKYDQVRVTLDPWTEREEMLNVMGFASYRFERIGDKYLTANGDTLEDVIMRCEYDEAFRCRSAIWLPIYEQKLTKGLMLTRYAIVKRPHAGIRAVRLPKLYFEEGLGYRTVWRGSELGELVYTMNLAPGEERSITIEQRSLRSSEDTRSTVSVLDLTEGSSNDLSTEIEKEAKSQKDSSSSNSWSASASGMIKGINFSASSSSESRMSVSDFTRNFERLARKAANNITRNTKQEVRTASTSRSENSRVETTNIKLKNINDGRTLNMLFYRLYNILSTSIVADDMSFLVEPGPEVVAGGGVVLPHHKSPQDLVSAFDIFLFENLPFRVEHNVNTVQYTATYKAYWSYIIGSFIDIVAEYTVNKEDTPAKSISRSPFLHAFDTKQSETDAFKPVKDLIIPTIVTAAMTLSELEKWRRDALEKLREILVSFLATTTGKQKAIAPAQEIRVASPGLYVDALMGLRPATEPYAEEMRAQTVLLRSAETLKEKALASYYNRLAGQAAAEIKPAVPVKLEGILRGNQLSLIFGAGAPTGDWAFNVDGKQSRLFKVDVDKASVVLDVAGEAWLGALDGHVYSAEHKATNSVLAFVIVRGA